MAPAPLDDEALSSVIRSFKLSPKQGIAALKQEDAAYTEPAELARFLHAHERILRLAIRSLFLERSSGFNRQLLDQYARLVDAPEIPIGRVHGSLEFVFRPDAAESTEASSSFCVLSGLLIFLFDEVHGSAGGSRALRGVVCIGGSTGERSLHSGLVSTDPAELGTPPRMAESSAGRMFGVLDSDFMMLASGTLTASAVFLAPTAEDQARWTAAIAAQLAPGHSTPAIESFGEGSSEVIGAESDEDDFVMLMVLSA